MHTDTKTDRHTTPGHACSPVAYVHCSLQACRGRSPAVAGRPSLAVQHSEGVAGKLLDTMRE